MKYALSIFLIFTVFSVISQPQYTDSTFGNNGKVVENTSSPYVEIVGAVLQQDGKSVVLAKANYNLKPRIVVIRYNLNGGLDSTFDLDGIVVNDTASTINYYPNAIEIQPDNKLLVCGYTFSYPVMPYRRNFVIRYKTNGDLDSSFGNNGFFYTTLLNNGNTTNNVPTINNLVVLPNGKLMVLLDLNKGNVDLGLIRLNNNGTVDSSFNGDGVSLINVIDNASPDFSTIKMQLDGKYIIGGSTNSNSGIANLMVVRTTEDGVLDSTYGNNGKLVLDIGPSQGDFLTDIAIQADGKVVACGLGTKSGNYIVNYSYTYLVRVDSTGKLDSSFGTAGKQYLDFSNDKFVSYSGKIRLQPNGKILIAGHTPSNDGMNAMVIARCTSSGFLDSTFSTDGIAMWQTNSFDSYGIVPLQRADGRIIIAGYASNGFFFFSKIGQLLPDGQMDSTVNTIVPISSVGSAKDNEEVLDIVLQNDQKILNVRKRFNGFQDGLIVSRHSLNGSNDSTYGNGGKSCIDMASKVISASSRLMTNGKLLIAAYCGDYNFGYRIGLIRLDSVGRLDSTFGVNGKIFKNTGEAEWNGPLEIRVRPDGKIVILNNNQYLFGQYDGRSLIKLNADGNYDSALNSTGIIIFPSADTVRYDKMDVQVDNKILLAFSKNFQGGSYATFVKRLNADGSNDSSFNNGYLKQILLSDVTKIVALPDGKAVLLGFDGQFARLNTNGSLDTTFGNLGMVNLSAHLPYLRVMSDTKTLDSGRTLLRGLDVRTSGTLIIKIKTNGLLDSTFGNNGTITTNVINSPYTVNLNTIAIQADGKILITGIGETITSNTNPYHSFGMTRLKANNLPTGRLYTFNGSGLWSNGANWSDGAVPPITIPAGSSIVVDPPTGSECVIDIIVHVQTGAKVTVKAGKKVRLLGNLIIQ